VIAVKYPHYLAMSYCTNFRVIFEQVAFMSNFEKTNSPSPRFPNDFHIGAKSGYSPSTAEQPYIDAVNAFVDRLAADEAADTTARYPEQMFKGRQAARATAMAALDADAAKFIAGQNAAGDRTRLSEIEREYASTLPKFGTNPSAQPRFEGDFDTIIASGYMPTSDEQALLDSIEVAKSEFAADKRADTADRYSASVVKFRELQRDKASGELRSQIENSAAIAKSAKPAIEQVVLIRGRYQALRDRLTRRLFNVSLATEKKEPLAEDSDRILDIQMVGGLPPPNDQPSPDKENLYVQINKALTVVVTVCERMDDRAERGWFAYLFGPNKELKKRSRLLQVEFLERLHGAAWMGLELEFTKLAVLTLNEVRNDFFVREAGRIKNMYVRRLGGWTAAAAIVLILAYIGFYTRHFTSDWGYEHKSFLLAACGAAIGTWASFSVRQVQFTFDDLVMIEEGSLDPPMRILFVIVLTMAACLLFWNGAINIEIGNLKTQSEPFRHSGSIALLIGLFCGLSERALATAIAGRAAAFVRGVGGAT
jgi:hypothetical protein